MKFDRTIHSAYNHANQPKEKDYYKGFSPTQIAEVFNYLMSEAYRFPMNEWPKMDKTVFSVRKNG